MNRLFLPLFAVFCLVNVLSAFLPAQETVTDRVKAEQKKLADGFRKNIEIMFDNAVKPLTDLLEKHQKAGELEALLEVRDYKKLLEDEQKNFLSDSVLRQAPPPTAKNSSLKAIQANRQKTQVKLEQDYRDDYVNMFKRHIAECEAAVKKQTIDGRLKEAVQTRETMRKLQSRYEEIKQQGNAFRPSVKNPATPAPPNLIPKPTRTIADRFPFPAALNEKLPEEKTLREFVVKADKDTFKGRIFEVATLIREKGVRADGALLSRETIVKRLESFMQQHLPEASKEHQTENGNVQFDFNPNIDEKEPSDTNTEKKSETGRPSVVKFEPAEGETIAPGVAVIKVVFDRDMKQSWALRPDRNVAFPELINDGRWIDKRTFEQKVRLKPNKMYGVAFNTALSDTQNGGFRSAANEPLAPILWTFNTSEE
jgi:hypothetical protein